MDVYTKITAMTIIVIRVEMIVIVLIFTMIQTAKTRIVTEGTVLVINKDGWSDVKKKGCQWL